MSESTIASPCESSARLTDSFVCFQTACMYGRAMNTMSRI